MSDDTMKHTSRTNWEKLESQDDSDINYTGSGVIPNGVVS